eukprot:1171433-Lingulodinium_polyedra.AAC.1
MRYNNRNADWTLAGAHIFGCFARPRLHEVPRNAQPQTHPHRAVATNRANNNVPVATRAHD